MSDQPGYTAYNPNYPAPQAGQVPQQAGQMPPQQMGVPQQGYAMPPQQGYAMPPQQGYPMPPQQQNITIAQPNPQGNQTTVVVQETRKDDTCLLVCLCLFCFPIFVIVMIVRSCQN